jgi:hypothetical protein
MEIVGVSPYGTALFGTVMLQKPVDPLSPVTMKDKVVVAASWFDVNVTLDICELVTFPLRVRFTVEPPIVVTCILFMGEGVGDGAADGACVGLGVITGVGLG